MPGYVKLFNSLLQSSRWCNSDSETKVVLITLMLLTNRDGVVETTIPGIAKEAGVPEAKVEEALGYFATPDKRSRSKVSDGRTIEEIDGGWRFVNYAQYRERMSASYIREQNRLRQQRHRASVTPKRDKSVTAVVTQDRDASVTDSVTQKRDVTRDCHDKSNKAESREQRDRFIGDSNSVDVSNILPMDTSCAARLESSALAPTSITIPLNDGSEFPIYENQITEWQKLYPAVDVAQQLRNIRGWNLAHRKNRKTKRGVEAHIDGWLRKEQDSAARNGDRTQRRQTPGEQFLEALRDSRRKSDVG